MLEVTFVTGNKYKHQIAQKALTPFNIKLLRQKLDTPEIQSLDVGEVAKYSAKWAAEKIGKPVIVSDAGSEILALNNFPGALLKYMNIWFSSEDILRLMEGKNDRRVRALEALAFCRPSEKPILFTDIGWGELALKSEGSGSALDKLMIWKGKDMVQGLIPEQEMIEYWAHHNKIYKKFGNWYLNNN